MNIIEEVLRDKKEIDDGIDNLTIDFGTFRYSPDERRKLKTRLTNQIVPLLETNGFVKKNNCFFRVHGDALLQIIGIVYPHNYNFYIASIVQPLYDFFQPLSDEDSSYHDLIGLRNDYCPDEARPIEYTLGLVERGKILSAQRDYEKSFKAVYLLLEQELLPKLDACVCGTDCIEYDQYGKIISLWRGPAAMISLYYRDNMIDACMKSLQSFRNTVNERIKEFSEAELMPYPQNFPRGFSDERFKMFYEQWYQNKNKALEKLNKTKILLETIADCVVRKDDKRLKEMMDSSVLTEHNYLGKLSKAFVKKYPLQQILHE